MNTRIFLSVGTAALMLGGAAVGLAGVGAGSAAEAGTRSPADLARRAAKAVDRHDPAAVSLAEEAVAAAPGDAVTRALLGRAYLQAGRFASAHDAFADAVKLNPSDSRSALNLALATIATGDWQGARAVLAAHGDIGAGDRGLALALSGDPAGGVAILTQAAREPGATAKTRQNLALALALSGQWGLAKAVAAADMSPADVDRRMAEWAQFAQPVAASDQVASLLGVHAVPDQGQPVALALATPIAPAALAPTTPVMALAAPSPVVAPAPEPVQTIAQAIESAPAPIVGQTAPAIVFAARREVVQPLPAPMIRAGGPIKTALAAPVSAPAMQGGWHVQLGAFRSAGGARDAWRRISRRHGGFDGHVPQGASYKVGGDALYRLSVGGFDRSGADTLCRAVRAGGGVCFVRRAAGDTVAAWARAGIQLAAR